MKKICISLFLSILFYGVVLAQHVEQVTQINYYGAIGLNPGSITPFNGNLYFSATFEANYHNSLCVSNGTEAGTSVVKRINNENNQGWGTSLTNFVVFNGKLFFSDNYTKKLWSSDGTAAGTQPYAGAIMGSKPVEYNGKLYFSGCDSIQTTPVYQLWVSDGTTSGTKLLKTMNTVGNGAPFNFFVFNNLLFFGGYDSTNYSQLWITDGTASGTRMIKKINATGAAWPYGSSYPAGFTAFNSKLYFSADDGVNGRQIWTSDGTTAGTTRITNINTYLGYGLNPQELTPFNGKLYFSGADTSIFYQLYATDGTAAGTTLIKADHSLVNGIRGFQPSWFTAYKNKLYMSAWDSLHYTQLWLSDGTTAGTVRVTDSVYYPTYLTVLNNTLCFQNGEVWGSDGTKAGTKMCPLPGEYGVDFSSFEGFVPYSGALFYNASYHTSFDYQINKFVDSPAGIFENSVKKSFTIYPNPTEDYLRLNTDLPVAGIQITDLTGKIVLTAVYKSGNTVSVRGLTPGMYLIEAQMDNGEIYFSKFLKK